MHRFFTWSLLLTASTLLSACESTPTDPDADSIVGTYHLTHIGNDALPVSIASGGNVATYTEGTLELESTHDLVLTNRYTFLGNNEVEGHLGTWTYTDGSLTLRNQAGVEIYPDNMVDGDVITLNTTFGGPDGVALALRYEK